MTTTDDLATRLAPKIEMLRLFADRCFFADHRAVAHSIVDRVEESLTDKEEPYYFLEHMDSVALDIWFNREIVKAL